MNLDNRLKKTTKASEYRMNVQLCREQQRRTRENTLEQKKHQEKKDQSKQKIENYSKESILAGIMRVIKI